MPSVSLQKSHSPWVGDGTVGRRNRYDPRRPDAVLDRWADWRRVTGNGRWWTRRGGRSCAGNRGDHNPGVAERVGGDDEPGRKPLPGRRGFIGGSTAGACGRIDFL